MSSGATRDKGITARCPLHAVAAVVAATAARVTLLLRSFCSERPKWAEMVPNRGNWNRAVIAAVEAVGIERRDDPHGSRFDFVGAIGPRIERALEAAAESSCPVGKQLSIDSNPICAHLHFASGKCDAWFEKRRSAIGASPCSAILAGERDIGRVSLRAELNKFCV